MHTLVVYCHPDPGSLCAALHTTVLSALVEGGHRYCSLDLYAENFNACLSRDEWLASTRPDRAQPHADPSLDFHVQALLEAEHLVFVFPVWMSGPPAMLKGWLDRVWRPGVAFLRARRPGGLPRPGLARLRRITVVTTANAPRWWTWILGNPNRRLFSRALRACCTHTCRLSWLQAHALPSSSPAQRAAFIDRVRRRILKVSNT